ncbi:MAG: sirohydrochlorin chelatase [Microcystaceae cyanobacterium]
MSTAYLLVAHGSRDRRPQIALQRLAYLVAECLTPQAVNPLTVRSDHQAKSSSLTLTAPTERVSVQTAVLECHPLPLHQQIAAIAANLQGYQRLQIVPLFLSPGVHVREDLPRELDLAQPMIVPPIQLQSLPYIGSSPDLKSLFCDRLINQSWQTESILIAHGSRRLGGNQPIENLAQELGIRFAFWSVPPHLNNLMHELLEQGLTRFQIIPYFLFAGGITDGIAAQVQQLVAEYPQIHCQLEQPLGVTTALARLIATWTKENVSNE